MKSIPKKKRTTVPPPPPKGNKRALGNRGGVGGPLKYKPEFAAQASKACEAGFTDYEIAQLLNVSEMTINNWKIKYPEFSVSLKPAKDIADDRVHKSLYRRTIEGDVTACIFWLKNRRPAEWRDRRETEHDGNVTVTIRRVRAKVEGESDE